jgi:hypothetical protein
MATPTNLPASFVAGAILTASQQNDLRGAFRVLQVVMGESTTQTARTAATYATSNLSATITPQSNTSKILVLTAQAIMSSAGSAEVGMKLVRGASTDVWTSNNANYFGSDTGTMTNIFYLDSPATTSSTTYTVHYQRTSGTGTVYAQLAGAQSNIILMEISA